MYHIYANNFALILLTQGWSSTNDVYTRCDIEAHKLVPGCLVTLYHSSIYVYLTKSDREKKCDIRLAS